MNLLERMAWISKLILDAELVYQDEFELQAGIHAALERANVLAEREVKFKSGNRIDMLVYSASWAAPHIGIEVKVAGVASGVTRQLLRYAAEVAIDGILLVTTKSKHHHIPFELLGKPVRLVSLIGAGL